jgi:hypothetical protein
MEGTAFRLERLSSPALTCALLVGTAAYAADRLEQRSGFIECGSAQIHARAQCYAETPYCATETLSFARRGGRLIVPLHPHYAAHEATGGKVRALEYHADSWACLAGKSGGRYLVVVMSRVAGGKCSECEYSRLYDLNGRLIATDLGFDAKGQPRASSAGRDMMHEVLGGPGPHAFKSVYP